MRKQPTSEQVDKALDTLLEHQIWPQSLAPGQSYSRRQDDTDGETGPEHSLVVYLSQDTDAHVMINFHSLRFRELFGGGMSVRTRNALLVLAEAIRRDNEARPQSPTTKRGTDERN